MSSMSMCTRLLSEQASASRLHNHKLIEAIVQGAQEAVALRHKDVRDASGLQAKYRYGLVSAAVAFMTPNGILKSIKALDYEPGPEVRRGSPREVVLIAASITGDVPRMKDLLDNGIDVNCHDGIFGAPLCGAAFGGHVSAVQLLLDHGADYKLEDQDGRSALVYGALSGHASVCSLLINAGAEVTRYSLWYAAAAGQDRVVSLLLNRGHVEPNDEFQSPLLIAIERGHPKVVEELLKDPKVDVNIRDWNDHGLSALELAACRGHKSIMQLILSHPNTDANSGGDGDVLASAVEGCHSGLVQLLLDLPHVDPNARPNDHGRPLSGGITPLIRAATIGHDDIVKLLISHKDIDVNLKSTEAPEWDGWAPLGKAVSYGHYDVVAALLEYPHTQVNIRQAFGETPLIRAAQEDLPDIVELLLACDRVDPNVTDDHGRGPVFHAADSGSTETMKILLKHPGIQVHVEDEDGDTPLMRSATGGRGRAAPSAPEEDYTDIVGMLLNHHEGEEPTEDHIQEALEVAGDYEVEDIEQLLQRALDSKRCS